MTQKRLRELVRVAYVKVAEYQRRGLVHLHVVIRLDRAMPDLPRATRSTRRRARFGVELLEDALRATVADGRRAAARRARRRPRALGRRARRPPPRRRRARREVAGYLAKYATKSTEQAGGVLHRVTEHQVDELPVREHVRRYLRAAFALAADPALADRRLAAVRAPLGYRGHCLTKSRRYSTTFKALRQAREQHVHEQILARSRDAPNARSPARASGSRASATSGRAISQPPTRSWPRRRRARAREHAPIGARSAL